MITIRLLAALLAAAAIAAPAASAATPPLDLHTLGLQRHQRQDLRSPDARDAAPRSPGHPSQHASVPPADPVVADSGSSVDWTPIVLAAGIGVCAVCLAGLLASRRRPRAVA
jgi:hypothetical protein